MVRERKGGRRIWGESKNSLVDLYHKEMEARDPCTDFGMRDWQSLALAIASLRVLTKVLNRPLRGPARPITPE